MAQVTTRVTTRAETRARTRTWVWHYDQPVERIWPVLADTARFNEAAGLPKHAIEEIPQPDGAVRYLARGRSNGLLLRWEERPVNWIDGQWFEHRRDFENGPLRSLCATLDLAPEDGGCRASYRVDVEPRNPLGKLLLATVFFAQVERTFQPLFESAGAYARGERDTQFDFKHPTLAAGAEARVTKLVAQIEESGLGHGLAQRLAELVLTRQEVDLWTIRPLSLARAWGAPDRDVIELCLQAVRVGLLRLRWDLLCPRCQVGKGSVLALDELPDGAHCDTCNIEYDQDYSNNVELAFHPARSVRPIEGGEYCLFGPMSTPHIKVQLTLEPGESRAIELALSYGGYRVRTLEPGPEAQFEWRDGGFPEIVLTDDTIAPGTPSSLGSVTLANHGSRRRTLIVEERGWMRDALTAKRVTALQAFRDLFEEEVLRPGDDVAIDYITIMFTDLKGSTAMYERIGDPQAYALVREHFALLGRAVRMHDGAVVKTIGDAIMAVFVNPHDALGCALQIHADFAAYNATSGKEPMIIKAGVHVGRCISVTLNNRLDYYGTAANLAARLQGQSVGEDLVMSPEFVADPLVAAALGPLAPRREQADLKGFDEPMSFFRIPPENVARARPEPSPAAPDEG